MSPVRSQPSSVSVVAGRLLVAEVAAHDLRPADPDLAVAVAVLARLGVDEPALGAADEPADRARVLVRQLVVVGEVRHGARLGHPVALADRRAEPLAGAVRGVGVHRRRAGDHHAERQVAALDARRLGETEHDRRRDVRARHPVLLEQVEELPHVEPRHRHDRRPLGEPEVHDDRLAVDVEERERADQHVVGADPVDRADLLHVRDEVAVREHHALRQPGRAAREREHGEVALRIHPGIADGAVRLGQRLELVHGVEARDGVAQRARRDHRLRVRARELLADLVRREQRVDRGDDRAERARGMEGDHPVGRVRAEQADGVALADPLLRQPGRGPRDALGELGVRGHRARRAVDQRRLVAALRRAAHHVRGERQRRDLDLWIRAAQDGHARSLRLHSVGGGGVETRWSGSDGGSPAASNVPSDSSSTPSTRWRTETAR